MNLNGQFIVYDRDETVSDQIDHKICLYYQIYREEIVHEDISNLIDEIIPYCFRPIGLDHKSNLGNKSVENIFYTFEQLKQLKFNADYFYSLTSSIDLIEEYIDNINGRNSLNGIILNCSRGWFGRQCEYSFLFTDQLSMEEIISNEFHRQRSDIIFSELKERFPCFIHLSCDYIGQKMCLDWREICNGEINCRNNGIDEINCDQMEMNECEQDEYRCHNGQCIPREFHFNGQSESECLDRSDEVADVHYSLNCSSDPSFRCEEHLCRKNWYDFSCSDGQCVQKLHQCHNGRDYLLLQSMIDHPSLSKSCLKTILCLTQFPFNETDDQSCEYWLQMPEQVDEYLHQCDQSFFFPSDPISSNHLRLLFENVSEKSRMNSSFLPDYICYNSEWCHCISPTYIYENHTCINSSQIDLNLQ